MRSAAAAGIGQWENHPPEWGQGALGYGRRFGSSYAEHLTETTLEYGASVALHEDNRFIPSGREGSGSRLAYALESPFLARRSDGRRCISFSHIGGIVAAALISRRWQPPSTAGYGTAASNAVTSLGVSMGFDVVREFWPRK